MWILICGLLLWTAAHLFKRVAPNRRAAMGPKGQGPVAGAILISVVLMVIGFRAAGGTEFWSRTPAMTGINNLLVLFGFYLFAASGAKTAITRKIRHPQLTAFKLWAVAHLLVNGNTESIVLFGGLLAWAVLEVIVINRSERDWTPPHPVPIRKEIKAIIATVVVFAIVAGLHTWLGYLPFG